LNAFHREFPIGDDDCERDENGARVTVTKTITCGIITSGSAEKNNGKFIGRFQDQGRHDDEERLLYP
jgi:hypothetical protein